MTLKDVNSAVAYVMWIDKHDFKSALIYDYIEPNAQDSRIRFQFHIGQQYCNNVNTIKMKT